MYPSKCREKGKGKGESFFVLLPTFEIVQLIFDFRLFKDALQISKSRKRIFSRLLCVNNLHIPNRLFIYWMDNFCVQYRALVSQSQSLTMKHRQEKESKPFPTHHPLHSIPQLERAKWVTNIISRLLRR
jgi:hypothetical protein